MTQQHNEALQLFRDLVDDLRDPNFVWQVVTLAACVGAAWLFARWWIGRHHQEGAGRLKDAGARLAFLLTAVARPRRCWVWGCSRWRVWPARLSFR